LIFPGSFVSFMRRRSLAASRVNRHVRVDALLEIREDERVRVGVLIRGLLAVASEICGLGGLGVPLVCACAGATANDVRARTRPRYG
jgi:hypothetical protein